MRTFPAAFSLLSVHALVAASALLAADPGRSASVPAVRAIAPEEAAVDWKVTLRNPDRFNSAGNLMVAWSRPEIGADVIRETDRDGDTVWECSLTPAGSLKRFVRTKSGLTVVAQTMPKRYSRVVRMNLHGEHRNGLVLTPGSAERTPPEIRTLQVLADGRLFISVPGYAFEAGFDGALSRELVHGSLQSAFSLADGRLICALADPNRFALYDYAKTSLDTIPLETTCQAWIVDRAEEPQPGLFRLYGCFCMPGRSGGDRETAEVVEINESGAMSWYYGSPHALRIDEFGTKKCTTYTAQVLRGKSGRVVLLDTYPGNCSVVELDPEGSVSTRIMALAALPNPAVLGLKTCPLIAAQLIE